MFVYLTVLLEEAQRKQIYKVSQIPVSLLYWKFSVHYTKRSLQGRKAFPLTKRNTWIQHAMTSPGLYPRLQHLHTHCELTIATAPPSQGVFTKCVEGLTGHMGQRGDNVADSLNRLTY